MASLSPVIIPVPARIRVPCDRPRDGAPGRAGVTQAAPAADTSRKPKESERDGQGYRFVSRGEMEADIKAGRYLEHGEYEGNLYGTRIDSIRAVVEAGKMCILDVNPQVGDTAGGTATARTPPDRGAELCPPRPGREGAENGGVRALRGVHRSPRPREAASHEPGGPGERRGHQTAHGRGPGGPGGTGKLRQVWGAGGGHSSRWLSPTIPGGDGETEAGFGVQEADAQRTVEESSRIQRGYGHYFDLSLTNDDLERTFGRLREAMDHLRVQPQWVPVTWVY